jgi:hypothetical protein
MTSFDHSSTSLSRSSESLRFDKLIQMPIAVPTAASIESADGHPLNIG